MFDSLNSRLLASYIAIVLICLILVGLGLLLFVRTSPLWTGRAFLRLEAAAQATIPALQRAGQPGALPPDQMQALLDQAADEQEVRVLLLDEGGTIRFDSDGAWLGQRIVEAVPTPPPRGASRGVFTVPGQGPWAFVARVIPGPGGSRYLVLFASPQSSLMLLAWFGENLLPSLAQAGLVALILSFVLAWLVARSVARPLRRVAAAAGAIAQGDPDRRAPASGPREVQELARAFNRMADRVAATQQAQRDFVANVSHELKTPLTSIQGFSQAIIDGTASAPAEVGRCGQVIHDEAGRMGRLVDELLHLARFDAGQVTVARDPVDVGRLLERCVERLDPQAKEADDSLLLTTADGLSVTGDADWLTQAFVNLLANAIGHTQAGRVEVTAQRMGDRIEVAIADTGTGIPSEDLDRIFERFYQAERSRQHRGGAGLGLPIAREVVKHHGGEIAVESVVGLGSRFVVRLPARESPDHSGEDKRG